MSKNIEISPDESPNNNVLSGTLWTIVQYGLEQGLRLVSNLILTRLLFPEAFGIMALVNVFLQGLNMFSDLGVNVSIIRSPRGNDPIFLDTAWTIRVYRGILLWIFSCLVAWPISVFYGQSILMTLIPFCGLTVFVDGFVSTKMDLLMRKVRMKQLVCINTFSSVVSLATMVGLAWFRPTVWVLPVGSILSSLVRVVLSHFYIEGKKNVFSFDKSVWLEIYHFGKWLFISSAVTFLAAQGDRLFLGKVLLIKELGVYSIAYAFSTLVVSVISSISNRVLFPIYSHLNSNSGDDTKARIQKIRGYLFLFAFPMLCFFIIYGQDLIRFLYDERYQEAGWMLQLLSLGSIPSILMTTITPVLFVSGQTSRFLLITILRFIFLFVSMVVGWHYLQVKGLILGIAMSRYLLYPFVLYAVKDTPCFQPIFDLSVFLVLFLVLQNFNLGIIG